MIFLTLLRLWENLGKVHDVAGIGMYGYSATQGSQIPLVTVARVLRSFTTKTIEHKQSVNDAEKTDR